MAHVHYDTDAIIKTMEETFGAVTYGENDPEEFKAVGRHRNITIDLARMAFDEANRGSDPDFIIWMVAHYCIEFLGNFATMTEAELGDIGGAFISHFLDCLRQEADGTAQVAATMQYQETEGGRA